MNSNSQRNNKDLETSSRDKYQISPKLMGQLEEEGFNTELIQPERPPTFDELVEELASIGELKPYGPTSPNHYIFVLKMIDLMNWIKKFRTYILHTNVLDSKIIEFHYLGHTVRITTPSPDSGCACFHYIQSLATNMLGRKFKLYDYTSNRSSIHQIQYDDVTVENCAEIYPVCLDIGTVLCMDHINLSRLTKTINNVETISCAILSQGRELTDHRARLDQISEALDNTTQDFIKHENLHTSQDSEIFKCVLALEKTTSNQFKYTSDEITNLDARLLRHRIKIDQISEEVDNTTQYFINHEQRHTELHKRISSLETTTASRHKIKQVNKMLAEQNTLMEVMSSNINNNTQMEELLSFEYRKLNSIYLQMEDRVTQLETTQQTNIKTMEIYITTLVKRLEQQMDHREEQKTDEINSKMKTMDVAIHKLEDKIQDLNIYNHWVLLIIASMLALISYLVYKVM